MNIKNKGSGNIVMSSEELIELSDSIIELIKEIENVISPAFKYLHETPFYEDGKCKDKVERIISVKSRSNAFGMNIEKDLYGKIQMLSDYYSLLQGYCLDTIIEYAQFDRKAAYYIKQLETSVLGGLTNE